MGYKTRILSSFVPLLESAEWIKLIVSQTLAISIGRRSPSRIQPPSNSSLRKSRRRSTAGRKAWRTECLLREDLLVQTPTRIAWYPFGTPPDNRQKDHSTVSSLS